MKFEEVLAPWQIINCKYKIDLEAKKILSLKFKSKDSRTLLENFISLSLLQVAGYVFPLLTVPYLAHTIGVVKYGEIAFASGSMIIFPTVVDYGFIFSGVRDVARCRDNTCDVSRIYSKVMWSRWLLVIVSFSLLLLLIVLVPIFQYEGSAFDKLPYVSVTPCFLIGCFRQLRRWNILLCSTCSSSYCSLYASLCLYTNLKTIYCNLYLRL